MGRWRTWAASAPSPWRGAARLARRNAGVVGILLAALYDPVWAATIAGRADFALAAFGLPVYGRAPPLVVVALAAGAGMLLALL